MKGTYRTLSLVLSRVRFDRKRHIVAGSAVMILMASFLTFNAVAAGLDEGIAQTISTQGHDELNLALRGGFNSAAALDVDNISTWTGVESASARGGEATGIEIAGAGGFGGQPGQGRNVSREIVLVYLDAVAESHLVVENDVEPASGIQGGRGFAAPNYNLIEGRWMGSSDDAVVTQSVATAGYGIGQLFTYAGIDWTVVGIIQNNHPAALQPAGTIAAGHVLVDGSGGETLGALIQLESDFFAIQSAIEQLVVEYPQAAFGLEANLAELQAQQFDAAQTQAVLSAAARLVAAAGAATVFAMSLFLLIGERKTFGTMSGIGFGRNRIGAYMGQKMALISILGAVAGGVLGWLVIQGLPAPEVSFAFEPVIDSGAWALASIQTLGAALFGSLAAFAITIRQDPIQALRAAE
jgi:hypothetical protein